jgi:hypothetical protein
VCYEKMFFLMIIGTALIAFSASAQTQQQEIEALKSKPLKGMFGLSLLIQSHRKNSTIT